MGSDVTLSALEDGFLARQAFETDVARRRRSQHLAFSYGDAFERASQAAQEIGRAMRAAG